MNKLIDAVSDLELIKRLKDLEVKLDNSVELTNKINDLYLKQKQMVNAKEFNQWKQYAIYKEEYQKIYDEILEYPFVGEYLELLEAANDLIGNISYIIENKINKELKNNG